MNFTEACRMVEAGRLVPMRSVKKFTWKFDREESKQLDSGWLICVVQTYPAKNSRGRVHCRYFVDAETGYCLGTMSTSTPHIADSPRSLDEYAHTTRMIASICNAMPELEYLQGKLLPDARKIYFARPGTDDFVDVYSLFNCDVAAIVVRYHPPGTQSFERDDGLAVFVESDQIIPSILRLLESCHSDEENPPADVVDFGRLPTHPLRGCIPCEIVVDGTLAETRELNMDKGPALQWLAEISVDESFMFLVAKLSESDDHVAFRYRRPRSAPLTCRLEVGDRVQTTEGWTKEQGSGPALHISIASTDGPADLDQVHRFMDVTTLCTGYLVHRHELPGFSMHAAYQRYQDIVQQRRSTGS